MQFETPNGCPQWDDGREQRLLASMLLATLLVAGVLSVLRLPPLPEIPGLFEIMVRIVQPAEDRAGADSGMASEAVEEQAPAPPEAAESAAAPAPAAIGEVAEPVEPAESGYDWAAARERAAAEYVESQRENYGYFDSRLAETRREGPRRYAPPVHEPKKPIWENVEVDTLGRKVLRSGDCYKVLDDPNVGSRVEFEVFGQFMTKCVYQRRLPKLLPWVPDIVDNVDYLREPTGYVKGEDGD